MPESVTDRFSKKHEYFFFMVKSEKYYLDLDAIRDRQIYGNERERFQTTKQWICYDKIPKEQSEMFGSREQDNIETLKEI